MTLFYLTTGKSRVYHAASSEYLLTDR